MSIFVAVIRADGSLQPVQFPRVLRLHRQSHLTGRLSKQLQCGSNHPLAKYLRHKVHRPADQFYIRGSRPDWSRYSIHEQIINYPEIRRGV